MTPERTGPASTNRYARRLLRLTCLAPDIQRVILQGGQPSGLALQRLILGERARLYIYRPSARAPALRQQKAESPRQQGMAQT